MIDLKNSVNSLKTNLNQDQYPKMSKIREIAWPEEYIELKRIEESMVCGICYEYINTTVITPCSHNYCSLCIRKYLHYKSQCPACFHVFFEKDLYINRAMDVLIQHYIKVREKVISLIENRAVYNTVIQQREETPSTPPVRPIRNIHLLKSPKVSEIKPSEPKTPMFSSTSEPKTPIFSSTSEPKTPTFPSTSEPKTPIFPSTSNISNIGVSSPKTHTSMKTIPSIAKMFSTPKRKETVIQLVTADAKSVSCPVCRVDISENHINVHLDACLKREVGEKVAKEKQKPKRQPMPKLVLRVMKDAELRKKMKEFGLATNGDRRALENRFTRYSTIYNAECDKLDPRPIADLLRQCEMEEKQERKMDYFLVSSASASSSNPTPSVRLQIEKDAKEEKIEEAQQTYRTANKSNFDKLIEEVRNRRKLEQNKKSDDGVRTTNQNSASTTDLNNAENDSTAKEKSSFNPSAEIPFNDSDSDESCPLQMYKSDDPMQFISSNLNDSSLSVSTSGSPVKRSQTPHINDFDKNSQRKMNNTSDSIYEVSTEESTDDEVQNSPIKNRKLSRKKVKLSKICPRKSLSIEGQGTTPEINPSIENNTRKVLANDLCNSIIRDFTFEGTSDDSLGEFAMNPEKNNVKVVEKGLLNENSPCRVSSRNGNSGGVSIPEETINRVILGEFATSTTDDCRNTKTDNLSAKIVNQSTVLLSNACDKKVDEGEESDDHLVNAETEKENDVIVANANSQSSTNEIVIRRPVRKRNRPSRFVENQTSEQDVDESNLNLSVECRLKNGSQDSCIAPTPTDGSLKRRRGRSKTIITNLPTDESLNPPKRPVRRRQVVGGHD